MVHEPFAPPRPHFLPFLPCTNRPTLHVCCHIAPAPQPDALLQHPPPVSPDATATAAVTATSIAPLSYSTRKAILSSLWSACSDSTKDPKTGKEGDEESIARCEEEVETSLLSTMNLLTATPLSAWPLASLLSVLEALATLLERRQLSLPSAPLDQVIQSSIDALQTKWLDLPPSSPSSSSSSSSSSSAVAVRCLRTLTTLSSLGVDKRPNILLRALIHNHILPCIDHLPPPHLRTAVTCFFSLDWPSMGRASVLQVAHSFQRYYKYMAPSQTAAMTWVLVRRGGGAGEMVLVQSTPRTLSTSTATAPGWLPCVHATLRRCGMKQLSDISRSYASIYNTNSCTVQKEIDVLFDCIAARAVACLPTTTTTSAPEDVFRVISAFQQVGKQPEALLDVVEEWADQRLAALSANALALALASFAKLGNQSQRLLRTARSCVESKSKEMTPRELSMVLWAFARLEFAPGATVLEVAQHSIATNPTAYTDREIANALWGLAKLGCMPTPDTLSSVYAGLSRPSKSKPLKFSGQSASLLLWSFATFYTANNRVKPPPPLLRDLGKAVAEEMKTLDPLSVALAAWGLGTLGHRHVEFVTSLSSYIVHSNSSNSSYSPVFLSKCTPQNVANIVWGLAKSGVKASDFGDGGKDDAFLGSVASICAQRAHEFTSQELFCVCWGFATMKFAGGEEMALVAVEEVAVRRQELHGLELSGLLWSLARLFTYASVGVYKSSTEERRVKKAVETVIAVARSDLPLCLSSLEESQLAMAIWGLGRLHSLLLDTNNVICRFYINDDNDDDEEEDDNEEDEAQTLLWTMLAREASKRASTLKIASLVSIVEGLWWIKEHHHHHHAPHLWDDDDYVIQPLASRAVLVMPDLHPWEFSTLVFYMAGLEKQTQSLKPRVYQLLEHAHAPGATCRCTPKGIILVTGAMALCGQWPGGMVDIVRKRLQVMSPSYKIDEEWYLWVLKLSIARYNRGGGGGGDVVGRGQQLRLPRVWNARLRQL